MATASSHYSRVISEELLCPVCLDELEDPKFLACAHNVCRECLEQMASRSENKIRCPVCRKSIVVPDGGVTCIPTNAVLVRLIEATPGRKEKAEIQRSLEKAKPVVEIMTKKMSDLDKALTDMTINVDKVEKEIHEKSDQLVEVIRKQEAVLCSEVEGFYSRKQDIIKHQKSNLFKLHSNAFNSVNLAEAILKQDDAIEISDITTALVQQLDEVALLNLKESVDTSTYDERLEFHMNTESTCKSILQDKKFARITRKFQKAVSRPSSASDIDWSKSGQILHRIGHKGSKKGFFKGPAGVTTNEFGEIAIGDFFNNRIQVFDSRLKFMFEFGKKGSDNGQFNGPTGVSYTTYNNIVVFDSNNNRVQIFNRNGEFVSKFGQQGSSVGEFGQTGTLTVDTSGDIIVTDSDNNRVQVFSNNGVFKLQFGGQGTEGFDNPLHTVAMDDEYFTTDSGNYCIKVFNSEGQYVRQFGRQGAGAGAFQCPRGLAIDHINELLLVSDSENHSIHILKLDGSCLGKFPTKKIPVGLTIFQEHYLLVCSYHSNCVQVISYT